MVAIFRKKNFVMAIVPTFIYRHTSVGKVNFQGPGLKVRVDMTEIFSVM